jgi:Protein kinase domain
VTQQPAHIGPYQILRPLGQGGMATVYVARHPALPREVAIKVLTDNWARTEESTRRFLREARTSARLHHPNIVTVHDAGATDAVHYLVLDLVQGTDLHERLQREGALPPREAARIGRDLARAMAYAHGEGVLHRDLKPHNVLLDERGNALLTDFGLAKELDSDSLPLTKTGRLMGTPAYMSPEQAGFEGLEVGPGTDVYGMGAILYEALTGQPPFEGESLIALLARVVGQEPVPPRATHPDVDAALEAIVLRCLEKDPQDRYPTMQALAEDLDAFLDGRPVTARPPSAARRVRRWLRSRAVLISAVAAPVAVAGAVILTASLTQAAGPRADPEPVVGARATESALPADPQPVRAWRWTRFEQEGRGPAPRFHHAQAWTPELGVVVHGGDDYRRVLGDTWAWSGEAWRLLDDYLPRTHHAMAYDSARRKLVLYAGAIKPIRRSITDLALDTLSDVYEWEGEGWASDYTVASPGPRFAHAMAWDADRAEVVMFGGGEPGGPEGWSLAGGLWAYDGQWRRLDQDAPGAPAPRAQLGLVHDTLSGELLVLGGSGSAPPDLHGPPHFADVSAFTPAGQWKVYPATELGPSPRRGFACASTPRGVVLYGGIQAHAGDRLADLWLWRNGAWERLDLAGAPPPLVLACMAYDARRDVVVLFGGSPAHEQVSAEVWELSFDSGQ